MAVLFETFVKVRKAHFCAIHEKGSLIFLVHSRRVINHYKFLSHVYYVITRSKSRFYLRIIAQAITGSNKKECETL